MVFGLCNAVQTFQRFMNQVMAGLNFVFIYLDDVCVASKNLDEHKLHVRLVFERLRKFGFVRMEWFFWAIQLTKTEFEHWMEKWK